VTAQLAREGIPVNHKAVEAEMVRQGLRGRSSRRKMRTTRRDPSKVPAVDLVGRDFERANLDQLWIGDATYIWTDEGWLYLATVIDACSRRLLGWSITDHLRTELCLDAIEAAVATRGGRRNLAGGVVFHTDHGTQYTADAFTKACRSFRIRQSMGTVGDSYDNAMAESLLLELQTRGRRRRAFRNSGRGARGDIRLAQLVQHDSASQLARLLSADRVRRAPRTTITRSLTSVRHAGGSSGRGRCRVRSRVATWQGWYDDECRQGGSERWSRL
jgi:transposase InsO family protein